MNFQKWELFSGSPGIITETNENKVKNMLSIFLTKKLVPSINPVLNFLNFSDLIVKFLICGLL